MGRMSRCSLFILALAVIVLIDQGTNASYIDTDNQAHPSSRDVQGFNMRPREACIERGSNCDHSPMGCCQPTLCRCNLWGANCRCARAGVFQV